MKVIKLTYYLLVQFSKNTSHHTGIQQSPYMALFGGNPRVGLRSTALPTEILERMVSENDPWQLIAINV